MSDTACLRRLKLLLIPYFDEHKLLTLAEVFEDCQNNFDNDKYQFLSLLDKAINLDEIVPVSFVSHFHAQTERPRKHQLYPMLKALLLQRVFSIQFLLPHLL